MKKLLTFLTLALFVNTKGQIITTVAGNATGGFSGDGGPATAAGLDGGSGVALDGAGNIYIADWVNDRIRMVNTAGIISTVAGSGAEGYSGDGGPATSAELHYPSAVAVDAAGNLYIADSDNSAIRKVNTSGIISNVAAGYPLVDPESLTLDASGNIYSAGGPSVYKITQGGIINIIAGTGLAGYYGDGGQATSAGLNYAIGVALDIFGNIYIADSHNHRIRKVNTAGIISTVAGNGTEGFSGDGGQATLASLNYPHGVTLDTLGNLYISDNLNQRIRKVNSSGIISTVVGNGVDVHSGDGGPATAAAIYSPTQIIFDSIGNMYIADGLIQKVTHCNTPISISINGAGAICTGNSITLKVSVSGANTYTWSANAGGVVSEPVNNFV
jgi:hypothetical protein